MLLVCFDVATACVLEFERQLGINTNADEGVQEAASDEGAEDAAADEDVERKRWQMSAWRY